MQLLNLRTTSVSYRGFSGIGRRQAVVCVSYSWGNGVRSAQTTNQAGKGKNKTKHNKRRGSTRLVNEGVHGWRLAEAWTESWSGTGARRWHVAPRRRCAGFQNRRAGFFMLVSLNKLNEYYF